MKRIVLGLAFGFVFGVANARDLGQWETTDPAVREWYQALMQPDNPSASCCGEFGRLLGRRDLRQGRKDIRDGHGRPAGRAAPQAAYRRRNGRRNPGSQAQMGQIESDRARGPVLEPLRLRILLRAARWRVARSRNRTLTSSLAFFTSYLHKTRGPAVDHPPGIGRQRFQIDHRLEFGIVHHFQP